MWIVRCVEFVEDGTPLNVYVGPFEDWDSVNDFMRDNSGRWDLLSDIALRKPPKPPQIHPNQAQIGDYIDPVVAN